MPLILVIGGTRSGKSEVAERLAAESGNPVTCLATGAAGDPEMAERIAAHRARRPSGWRTIEGHDPLEALAAADGGPVLIDSLGGWVAAMMAEAGLLTEAPVEALGSAGEAARAAALERVRALARAAASRPAPTVVVAEEAGLGLVPEGAAARRYLDLAGEAAQILAADAAQVLLVVAGRPIELARPRLPAVLPELREHGDRMVPPGAEDFAVNVEADAPPPWLRDALGASLQAVSAYPDEHPALTAVARRHRRQPEEVVLTNGATEAFWLVAAALRPRRPVCVHPSFTEPEAALRAHGHPVERAFRDRQDFALDPAAVPAGADLVVLGNPNNPSGTLDPAERVAELCRPGRVLVVDEAFMDFVPGESESLAGRHELPGLVVVRSLTKLFSLAGVRAGYALAPPPIAERLRRVRPTWSVNALALAAIRACLERAGATAAIAERVAAARAELQKGLARLGGVRTWPSATNFLLMRVAGGERVHARLLERGIAVRPARTFPGLDADHLRIAVRSGEANRRLLAALEEALA